MAKPEVAELLTPPRNFAVVQLPGRKFPGVVFQGDSLSILREQAASVSERVQGTTSQAEAADLREQLDDILRGYLAVLRERDIEPPFVYRPPEG